MKRFVACRGLALPLLATAVALLLAGPAAAVVAR